jgi:hypothetical protein
VIGSGGKVIREIVEKTGAKIDIDDDGTSRSPRRIRPAIDAAMKWIKSIVSEPEVGMIYKGKVVKTVDFGAFVNFFGAKRRPRPHLGAGPQARQQDLRRRQGRRQGLGEARLRLRRARQGRLSMKALAVDQRRNRLAGRDAGFDSILRQGLAHARADACTPGIRWSRSGTITKPPTMRGRRVLPTM